MGYPPLRFGANVRRLQQFIGQSPWSREGLLRRHQARVGETLGEAVGVVLVRISGMRWPVELILRAGKVEVGFDHY